MNGTLIPERWEQILDMLDAQGGATVEEMAEVLGVSASTIRRDLAGIQRKGLIKRTRGGAMPQSHVRVGLTLADSRRLNPEEKEIIGEAAALFVKNDDTVMIDGGFTTYQVARNIQANNLTVITNSLDVAQTLAGRKDITLIVIGGELSVETGTNLGSFAQNQVEMLWADKAIIGTDAVSPEHGVSSPNPMTADTKKSMVASSRELIVVADHTKLGRFSPYRVASCEQINILVTDSQADPVIVDAFRDHGVEVVVASMK